MEHIPLTRPYFDNLDLEAIKEVLDSGWVSSKGPKSKEMEELIKNLLRVDHVIPVSNCTSALHLSLLAYDIGPGDEVLVSDYTFPATGHVVLHCGAKPIFVDVDMKTYNMDINDLERKITNNTKAIIPVHAFGQPADMDAIMKIAKVKNLKVIEDAACALGSLMNGQYAGTFGDVGCFSLHARKLITTGEGGFIVTNDENAANRMRSLSDFGSVYGIPSGVGIFIEPGFNYKLSDISASLFISQFRKLDEILDNRRKVASTYSILLEEVDDIIPPFVDVRTIPNFQSYVTVVGDDINRDLVISLLKKNGIGSQIGTYCSFMQPAYQYKGESCNNSYSLYYKALSLPIYYGMSTKDIVRVVDTLKQILKTL
jgi:perosamine synthetase